MIFPLSLTIESHLTKLVLNIESSGMQRLIIRNRIVTILSKRKHPFMKQFFQFFIVSVSVGTWSLCGVFSAFAMADKPPIVLPQGVLSADQIQPLFAGQTVIAINENDGSESVLFFARYDQLKKVQDGWLEHGTWSVRKDGRLCVDFPDSGRDCRIVVREQEVYRQYAVKLDSKHRYEWTYNKFVEGNHLVGLSDQPILPEGTLKRGATRKLFSGNTVESVTATQGRVSHTYYDPNGSVEQLRNGVKRYGQWRVTKSARICLDMEGTGEKCRIIVKEGSEVKKYIVRKDGNHQHSVSYRNFTPGKTF